MKKWGFLLAALNSFDCLSTYVGMKLHLFNEGNPLLAEMPPEGIVFLKTCLSLLLMYSLFKIDLNKLVFKFSLIAVSSVYSVVAVIHLYWMSIVWPI